jgi:transposase
MLWRGEARRVFAYGEALDLRRSFDGLLAVAKRELDEDVLSGSMFLFINRKQTLTKIVFWDRTGWCVLAKRLERGKFQLRGSGMKRELSGRELELLLDGVLRGNATKRKMR